MAKSPRNKAFSADSSGKAAPRIAPLPPQLIDQIAAGEVVERPASVVKELVENALDAEATRIAVTIRDGGKALIAVSDDGIGMSAAEVALALERHATSKIRVSSDLQRITTCGFRGEALPAIASVSELRLESRARGTREGAEVRVSFGERGPLAVSGCTEGTRVEVAQLFGAVPARRKFLKSSTTEWGHIADVLQRVALSRPNVHFDVVRDGRPVYQWPMAHDAADRVAVVLNERDAAALVPVASELGAYGVRGYASRPDVHRGTAAGVHCFVNGRPVRDRVLRSAVVSAYRDWLPRGRYPTVVLYFDVPTDMVDVNVHPAKSEVRFADPQSIHRLTRTALRDAVARRSWFREPSPDARPEASLGSERAGTSPPTGAARRIPEERGGEAQSDAAASDWLFADRISEAPSETPDAPVRFGELRCLGQVMSTYLVLEEKGALFLVDQHAAHERVLYERLRGGWLERGVPRQTLLLSVQVELEPPVLAAMEDQASAIERLGFEIERFGESGVLVRAIPAVLADRDPARLVRRLGEALVVGLDAGEFALLRALDPLDRLAATVACHGATRAGDPLAPMEQEALLRELDEIPWAPTCPHGRPVAVPISQAEIEGRFGRR